MMMASPLTGMDNLPPKDVALFKSTLKFFEHRQYKKGLKVCEQLLKKHPSHGESFAMKGLFLGHMGKKEEGYELIRTGIKFSLKSCVCWHVYGLLYRFDKNYEEAMKCYRNALRFDKENSQILRDLAVLQLQTQMYGPLCDTRYQILVQRPALKQSWIALAMAYHLDGAQLQAAAVLDAVEVAFPFESKGGSVPSKMTLLEQAELLLYKSMVLEEAGKLEEALVVLNPTYSHILPVVDRWSERKASILLALGRHMEALDIFSRLLESNPDSLIALKGYIECETVCKQIPRRETLRLLEEKYPKSLIIQKERLEDLVGSEDLLNFLLDRQLKLVKRGIPSVFSTVRPLYDSQHSVGALREFADHLNGLVTNRDSLSDEELCWIHLYLGQHFSVLSDGEKCVAHFEMAVELQPKLPEVFYYYAKALYLLGMTVKAADCIDAARRMDTSDRFLNSQTVKHMLRADRVDRAKELAVVFLKKGPSVEAQLKDLVDMQVLWFAYEMGVAFQRRGDHELALEYFDQISKHFEDFYTDLFDFHNYIFRRMTYCDYIRTLRYQTVVCGDPVFSQSAPSAITSLLVLHDEKSQGSVDERLSALSLSGSKGYLERAKEWTDKLLSYRAKDPQSYSYAFEVYRRQNGQHSLKAAKALYQALSLGGAPVDSAAAKSLASSLVSLGEPISKACGELLLEAIAGARASTCRPSDVLSSPAPIDTPNLDRCLSSVDLN